MLGYDCRLEICILLTPASFRDGLSHRHVSCWEDNGYGDPVSVQKEEIRWRAEEKGRGTTVEVRRSLLMTCRMSRQIVLEMLKHELDGIVFGFEEYTKSRNWYDDRTLKSLKEELGEITDDTAK